MTVIDFEVRGAGDGHTVLLLVPQTQEARAWCDEHLPDDAPRFGDGIAVENRYVGDIVEAILADGLEVE